MEASFDLTSAARRAVKTEPIPWFVFAALFGSASILIGGEWDIAWHQSIGRDTFWSPPHLAIYLGAIVAGASAGWVVLKTTFAGQARERAESVRIWRFRGPLGAFACIWGACAMLSSAPFDDWWHNTYGLDVEILSPPHVVLALGIGMIQIGAMLTVLALQNREEQAATQNQAALKRRLLLRLMFVLAAGMLLKNATVMTWTYMQRVLMHSSIFYQVGCAVLPLFIIAAARSSRLRRPALAIAAIYTVLSLALLWVLPLFPAEPKLGPVRQQVTHLVPLEFPLLLIVPALALDWLMGRIGQGRDWLLAVLLGGAFSVALLAAQWPLGNFLMSPLSRNWVFATHYFAYFVGENWYSYRHEFYQWDASAGALLLGLASTLPLAVISSRIGLWWGSWMSTVQR